MYWGGVGAKGGEATLTKSNQETLFVCHWLRQCEVWLEFELLF